MEIVDAIIFVQSFVWATLILKQSGGRSWLGLAFFTVSAIYLVRYANIVFETNIPEQIVTIGAIVSFLLSSFYQVKNTFQYLNKFTQAFWWVVALYAFSIVVFSVTGISQTILWPALIIFGVINPFFDAFVSVNEFKKRSTSGSFLGDAHFREIFFILLIKTVVTLFAAVFLLSKKSVGDMLSLTNSFHGVLSILIFLTGYYSVTSFFKQEQRQTKSVKSKKGDSRLAQELTKLMQEQKVYLDCELTLGKLADMLQTNENEVTSILNVEMGTSFYKLVNDYRIETVKQKLKEPDSKNFTIMASAYESGFNSKSTFYRIFKEYTNMTPKEYLSKIRNWYLFTSNQSNEAQY